MRNNGELISFLLTHSQRMSQEFCSSDAALWRRRYRVEHPTEVAALKCMDGRLHLPVMTETPPGIIQPFRNLGGKFKLGWPYFGELMDDWVTYSISQSRDCLVLVTYHYAKGDVHRGCKGHEYDTEAAREYADQLRRKFEEVFGNLHTVVYPVTVGIETDEDALVIHGRNGEILNVAEVDDTNDDWLRQQLTRLFDDMKPRIIDDFIPLLQGNVHHIKQVRASQRPLAEAEHREQILAIGRGFDWLHEPNRALIVGPYSPNLAEPIKTAASLLLDNIKSGRIPAEQGVVLLTSGVYRDEVGPERLLAREKAIEFAEEGRATIARDVPELTQYLRTLIGTTNINTRLFTPIDETV